MKWLVVSFLLFSVSLSSLAQSNESNVTTTTVGGFDIKTSAPGSRWMLASDARTFGINDIYENYYSLKTTYRPDHRFNVYLFFQKFSVQNEDMNRNWESSGTGLDYAFYGSFNSGPLLRAKTQNVESQQWPFRQRISISSYGVGYQQIMGKINIIFSFMLNTNGYRGTEGLDAPYDYLPGVGIFSTELGYLF